MKLGVMLITAVAGLGGLLYLATKPIQAANEIPLEAGWNEVTYTGSTEKAGIAFQSIAEYLEIAMVSGVELLYDSILETGMVVNIKVTEACTWKF